MNKKQFRITKRKRDILIAAARNTGLGILSVCEKMLEMPTVKHGYGSEEIRMITALYTMAVEEFGKIKYLKSLNVKSDKVTINRNREYESHKSKFRRAMSAPDFPSRCRSIHTSFIPSGKTKKPLKIKKTVPDFVARERIVYSNVDDKGNPMKYPRINKLKIKRNVSALYDAFLVA